MGKNNWFLSDRLILFDAPQLLNARIHDNFDRWELLQYLLGDRKEKPKFIREAKYDKQR